MDNGSGVLPPLLAIGLERRPAIGQLPFAMAKMPHWREETTLFSVPCSLFAVSKFLLFIMDSSPGHREITANSTEL
jgi:hypothetical protein